MRFVDRCFFRFITVSFFALIISANGVFESSFLVTVGARRRMLPAAAARLTLRLGTGRRGQKLLPTVVAAKVECLSIAFGVECGGFVHGHAADGIDCFGSGFIHSLFLSGSFLIVLAIGNQAVASMPSKLASANSIAALRKFYQGIDFRFHNCVFLLKLRLFIKNWGS